MPISRPIAAPYRLCALAAALTAGAVRAQAVSAGTDAASDPPVVLRTAPALRPAPAGEAMKQLPAFLQAQSLRGTPGIDWTAEGEVEFRRGGTTLRADRLHYDQGDDLASGSGHVRLSRDGNVFSGPAFQLEVKRFEGWFLNPTYRLARTGAGGTAERIDFQDIEHAVATKADYTSCGLDGSGVPAWLLEADRLTIDAAAHAGVAEGARLKFYGTTILALPTLSFPLDDDRKSGWLPPTFGLDSKGGVTGSIPFYWNIAPNRDATFTPAVSSRRGGSLDTDFRYLEPNDAGEVDYNLLPHDRVTGLSRYSLAARHESDLGDGLRVKAQLLRVSDDDYWKDFPGQVQSSLTPRLLASDLQASRPFGDWTGYARVQRWQVLQTVDTATRIEAPYAREPQIGARYAGRLGAGFDAGLEFEFNRFANPQNASLAGRPAGDRLHVLGSLAWTYATPGWTLTPKFSFNAASYDLDAPYDDPSRATPSSGSRIIPTASLDSAWVFERTTRFFGLPVMQTLEPRLYYVNTQYRDQTALPNFDAYPKDFNFDSIFTDNAYSGVDRVSDAHQITAGVTTRFIDPQSGAERLRLGLAQRYLLRDQRITPDQQPLRRHLSDLLLLASTDVVPSWNFDTSAQYNPDTNRVNRSVTTVRYSPGPFRTVSATYRLTRGLAEQIELGWQWPIFGAPAAIRAAPASDGAAKCGGTLYGVGRINYSTLEKRLVDAVAGVEYDAGCWVGRIVATRQSTGLSEATTRILFQMELVGLSRLGSNPLQVLKDNVPGYRLLREGRAEKAPASNAYD